MAQATSLIAILLSYTVTASFAAPDEKSRFESLLHQVTSVASATQTPPPPAFNVAAQSNFSYDPIRWNKELTTWTLLVSQNPEQGVEVLNGIEPTDTESYLQASVIAQALAILLHERPSLYETLPDTVEPTLRNLLWGSCLQVEIGKDRPLPEAVLNRIVNDTALTSAFIYQTSQVAPQRLLSALGRLSSSTQKEVLSQLLPYYAHQEPETALRIAEAFPQFIESHEFSQEALLQSIEKMSQSDPEIAERWIDTLSTSMDSTELQLARIRGLAESDPEAALVAVDAMTLDEEKKAESQDDIFRQWKRNHPRDFADYAATLPVAEVMEKDHTFLRNWPEGFEVHAVELALSILDQQPETLKHRVKNNPFVDAFVEWAESDPSAAGAWIDTRADEKLRDLAYSALIRATSEQDPQAASQLFSNISSTQVKNQVASDILAAFADRDPQAGLQWLRDIDNISPYRDAVMDFFKVWAAQDVEGAMANFPRDLPLELQKKAIYWIGRNFVKADFDLTTAWLKSLQSEVSLPLYYSYSEQFTYVNPEGVNEFIRNHPRLDKNWHSHQKNFMDLADTDLDRAIALLDQTSSHGRYAGIDAITKEILNQWPEKFETWLNRPWSNEERDHIRIAYGFNEADQTPEQALELTLLVAPSHRHRQNTINKALEAIAQKSPEKAYEIVNSNPQITQKERYFLLDELQKKYPLP